MNDEGPRPGSPTVGIRPAWLDDLDSLYRLEQTAFASDRLSRRSLRRYVTAPTAGLMVATVDREVAGYVLVLFRTSSFAARLYSIAVDHQFRGQGIGRALLAAAEASAIARGARTMRLEVKVTNHRAAGLYRRQGYHPIARLPEYYADGADAMRHEKILSPADADRYVVTP